MGVRLASPVGADTHRSPLKGFAVPRVARVLVVDDDPLVLEIVKELLVAQGYEMAATHSGAQAFAMMAASPPDVLLLDINLPVVDGVTVLRRVRTLYPQMRVIMLTGNADEAVAKDTLRRGAFDYVVKPFDFAHLARVVAAAAAQGGG
jgi:DNA-binding response OmpR family regulator